VDWNEPTSLDNWFVQLNLACESKARIGLIGSSIFFGWALSAIFLPRLADLYGRKLIVLISLCIQLVSFIGFYFSRNINVTTAFAFVFGTAAVGRCSISFLYLIELMPQSRQVLIGTFLHVSNGLVGILGFLYFWQISRNWLWIEIVAGAMNLVSIAGILLLLPESPKYLLTKKRFQEARDCINKIAKINGKEGLFNGKFEAER